MVKGMKVAGEAMVKANQAKLNVPGPEPSPPGQPPHRQSGDLHDDQSYWLTGETTERPELHVGVRPDARSVLYAALLAKGTSRMAARPWTDDRRLATMAAAEVVRAMENAVR